MTKHRKVASVFCCDHNVACASKAGSSSLHGGQSLARERRTGEHEAHSPTRRTFHDNAADGRQRLLQTVLAVWRWLRKKPRLSFDELERALDLRSKLRGRPQLAVSDEGTRHASAGEAIG